MFLQQQISMLELFLKVSCDTEDWSYDAENQHAIAGFFKYIQIKTVFI